MKILPFSHRPGFLSATVGLVIALLSMSALANEYDLELVIFLSNEHIGSDLPRHGSDLHAQLDQEMQGLIEKTGAVTTLPVISGKMADLVTRLQENPAYTVLQYTTWRQQVELISTAPYVDVSPLSLGDDETGLKGLVRFYHSPLLYVDLFLKYTPLQDELDLLPVPDSEFAMPGADSLEGPITEAYFLKEKRRVKLTELHYLDHPRLGAILSVWPIEEAID